MRTNPTRPCGFESDTRHPVVGGDEVLPDEQREGEHRTDLDVVLVRTYRTEGERM